MATRGGIFLSGAPKPARISFEGNIGVGKSTILKLLQSHPLLQQITEILQEPIWEWQNVSGTGLNMLDAFYKYPESGAHLLCVQGRLLHVLKPGTDDFLTALGILGNITAMGLFLSPMPTFYKICKAKSTGQYSALPYVATLLNCMLWTFYGSGAVAGLIFVVSINVAGLIMEGCYVTIHLLFGSHNSRKTISILLAVISILYGALVSVVLVVVKSKDSRAEVVGSVCVIIGVLMYAAPLSVMKEVIRSQSVASMPFLLSFACFCNGLIWTSYGIIKENMSIYIPNGLGTLLTIAQLVLWCIYYKKGVRKSSERDTANLSGHHAVDVE